MSRSLDRKQLNLTRSHGATKGHGGFSVGPNPPPSTPSVTSVPLWLRVRPMVQPRLAWLVGLEEERC